MTPEIPEEVKKQFSKADWRKIAMLVWTEEDWADWYHCIGFALYKIQRRHERKPAQPAIDFQI